MDTTPQRAQTRRRALRLGAIAAGLTALVLWRLTAYRHVELARELALAAARRDRSAALSLLARGADPNLAVRTADAETLARDVSSALLPERTATVTALQCAFPDGPTLTLLLDHGATRIQGTPDSDSLPMMAVLSGRQEILAAVRGRTRPETPIDAAILGDVPALERLVTSREAANQRDGRGKTPLAWAAQCGNTGAMRLLIARGANTDAQLPFGHTPLVEAARSGNPAALSLLMDAGVSPDDPNAGRPPLHAAADVGSVAALKALLDRGADIEREASGQRGYTALVSAVNQGHEGAARYLLMRGARPDRRQGADDAPLLYTAAQHGEIGIVRALLEHGAHPNAAQRDGLTPLMAAADLPEPTAATIVRLLLAHGADPHQRDRFGRDAVRHALDRGRAALAGLMRADARGTVVGAVAER